MNDETDKPLNTVGDDALEARITAWVLGEASSFEAGEVEKLCAADPVLGLFERRLRVLHGLVAEDFKAGPAAEWKLAAERRTKITDLLGVEPEVAERIENTSAHFGRRALLALAACAMIGFVSYSLTGGVGQSGKTSLSKSAVDIGGGSSFQLETGERDEVADEALAQLERAVVKQKDLVDDKRKLLSQIIRQEGIIFQGDSNGESVSRGFGEEDQAESAGKAYDELEQDKIALESQIETLLKYDGPQLMNYASGLSLAGNVLPEKVPQLQMAKREVETLQSSGLGPDHPEFVAKNEKLQALEAEVGQDVADLRETLKAKLELTKEQAARAKTRLDATVDDAINQGIANRTFVDAKNDFESSQRLLETLQLKQISEKMQLRITEDAIALNSAPAERGGTMSVAKPAAALARRSAVDSKDGSKTVGESLARVNEEAGGLPEQQMADYRYRLAPEPEALAVPPPTPPARPAAIAVNEPSPAVKTENFGVDRSDHEIGYAGGGGGGGGGLPAEDAPAVASRSNADFIPQITTRGRVPAEGMTIPGEPAATSEAASDFITGGTRSGDAAISRNNIDAILNNPERIGSISVSGSFAVTGTAASDDLANVQLDTKGAALEANGGVEADFGYVMGRGAEGALSKGVKVSPPLNANLSVADGRALGETRDSLLVEGRTSGVAGIVGSDDSERLTRGVETGKPVDLLATGNALFDADAGGMPQDPQSATFFNTNGTSEPRLRASVRVGSERTDFQGDATTFGDLDGMGRLAEASKSQGERFGTHTGYRYANSDGQVMDGIADLSDLARKQSEEEPTGTINGRWMGRTADEAAKEPSAPQVGEELAEADERGQSGADGFFKTPAPAQAPPASAPASAIETNGFVQGGAPVEWQTKSESTKARVRGTTEVTSGLLTGTVSGGLKADMTIEALALSKTLETASAKPEDEVRAQLLKEVEKSWELSVQPEVESPQEEGKAVVDGKPGAVDPVRSNPALAADGGAAVDEVRRQLYIAEGSHNLGKYEDARKAYEDVLRIDPYNKAARRGMEKVAAAKADYYRAAYDHTREQLLTEEDEGLETPATLEQKKQAALDLMSEVVSAAEPFSTFSLHVSDASFKLAQAAMERGEVPSAEGIRPEEFYNAFDYGDPAPASGEPVVCVTEQSAHPAFAQRNLMRIAVRTGSQGRGASTPLNLTLLLDHSGSMEREDRNAGLAMAVRQLSSLLKEGDTITVAGFSRQPRLLADRLPGARAQELNELIARTPSEGGTNLEEGLKLGEELAKRQFNPAAQNRVVLFTDGAANLGDARPEALQARIEGLRQQGIAFDAAGFGADGLNDKLLERLTRDGNGRYYIVDGPEDADAGFAKQLAGAFRPAAENVKVQVRFNPARVAKYKLIGFEEHRLKKEDFRNDAVDAAEMAAEEAGNALYQIETLPQGEGEVGEVSVRFHDVASGQMVERTWTIPYDAEAPAFDQATPSIQLAGLAAFTAEKLRAAPMAEAVDFQQLGQVYAGVRARYPNSKPVADLGSMIGKMK